MIDLDNEKVKEHIRFHYLLTEILLFTLILLEWNIFLSEVFSKIKYKLITQNIFRIQDNDSITCGFHFIAFLEYILKNEIIAIYFLRMTIKRITK